MAASSVALLVGIDRYDDPALRPLHAPAHDLAALARVLGDPDIGGFQVQRLLNEPVQRIREQIAELFAGKGSSDRLLLYFAGHGMKDDAGDLYLTATDTKLRLLNATAVSAAFVRHQIDHSQSRRIILLLDCCYGSAFSNDAYRARGVGGTVDVLDRLHGRGRVVITASTAMQYAYEANRYEGWRRPGPSLFTGALVQGLASGQADRDQDGWISVHELYQYLYDEVRRQTPDQTPTLDSQLEGDLYIAQSRACRTVPTPGSLPAALYELLAAPDPGRREKAARDLDVLLGTGSVEVADEARRALGRLREDDSRRVSSAAAAVLDEHATTTAPQRPPAGLPGQPREPVDSPFIAQGSQQRPTSGADRTSSPRIVGQRESARLRARREAARRLARRRRLLTIGGPLTIVLLVVSAIVVASLPDRGPQTGPRGTTVTTTKSAATDARADAPTAPAMVACGGSVPPRRRHPTYESPPSKRLDPGKTYLVTLKTSCGSFSIRLDPRAAPITSANFAYLAGEGFYDSTWFHRIVPGGQAGIAVVQGGDPKGSGRGGPGYTIEDEKPASPAAYKKYSVAMATSGQPNSGGSQFFISTADNSEGLQADYAVFGQVVAGQAVVDQIARVPVGGASGDTPTQAVWIERATVGR